eukprot:scaffold3566_cov119-Isochrysis_galbana.AAC.6
MRPAQALDAPQVAHVDATAAPRGTKKEAAAPCSALTSAGVAPDPAAPPSASAPPLARSVTIAPPPRRNASRTRSLSPPVAQAKESVRGHPTPHTGATAMRKSQTPTGSIARRPQDHAPVVTPKGPGALHPLVTASPGAPFGHQEGLRARINVGIQQPGVPGVRRRTRHPASARSPPAHGGRRNDRTGRRHR